MFPSATSLGNLLLKSVRGNCSHWEEEVILPALPRKLFPPAPPTGKN